MDLDSTLESTVTDSFFDDTYDANTTGGDDSMTELKTREPIEDNKSNAKQNSVNSTISQLESNQVIDCDSEVKCIDSCTPTQMEPSIRCNICMDWFHTPCVGISDVDTVGAWTCAGCRK